jgi:hypothetical protein
VDGIEQKQNGELEVVRLNLLSKVGRETAGVYKIKIVPATVLVDDSGQILYHHVGMPKAEIIYNKMNNLTERLGK